MRESVPSCEAVSLNTSLRNVDTLLAIRQAIYPRSYTAAQADTAGTIAIAAGAMLTLVRRSAC